MACIAGRLRAARCAAIAAESPSAACSLFQSDSSDLYPSWFRLPWSAAVRSIITSTASSDAPAGAAGDGRRPDNNSARRRQRPSDRPAGSFPGSPAPGSDPAATQPRSGPRRDGASGPRGAPRDGEGRAPRGAGGGGPSASPRGPRWDRGGGPAGGAGPTAAGAGARAARPPGAPTSPSSSTFSSSLTLLRPQQQQPQQQRWDLATRNAAPQVLQLIGDPRCGVADDTTSNPFGEVTVDMVHYQPSNEVYWFKYEFAGTQTHGSHRDARLSDYTRNLIYLMRAKDPQRWTIQALADKFRIRKQRVLAILALKELEAQRMEDGKLMSGPLSAYQLAVRTEDILLDPLTGNPRLKPPPAAAAAAGAPGAPEAEVPGSDTAAAATPGASEDHIDAVVPRVVAAAQKLQLQLVQLLAKHGYDTDLVRQALLADLDRAAGEVASVLAGDAGGEAYLKEELQSYRTTIEAVVAAVETVVAGSPLLMEERRAAALRRSVESVLAAAGEAVLQEADAVGSGGAAGGTGAPSEALVAVRQQLGDALEPVMQGVDDAALQRAFFSFPPKTRGPLLRLLPDLSIRFNAAGVDLSRAAKDAAYRGPSAAAAAAAAAASTGGATATGELQSQQLSVDVFGFMPVPEHGAAALVAALQALERSRAALVAKVVALDRAALAAAETSSQGTPAASDAQLARSLVRQYVATDLMWADLLSPSQAVVERRLPLPQTDPARKRRALEVLHEADPTAVPRALQVEAAMQLRFRRAFSEADALAAGVGAAAAATEAAAGGDPDQPLSDGEAAAPATRGARAGDRASWDALAAFLEARVAGKVYGTGSGERHVTRMPTYPAFEGYSLEEFDRVKESELSELNRKVAQRLDEQMYDRFRKDLLYNLGVRGEKLRLSAHEQGPWPSNLRTELSRPVVVYGIAANGTTQYPPLYVATGDGKTRPLNDQEKVFQERRESRAQLPYYMARIRRMPELE